MALKPTVLLYNFTDKRRRNKVNAFCAMHGIRVRTVEKEQYGKPLIMLADKEAEILFADVDRSLFDSGKAKPDEEQERESEKAQEDFSDEMLVMCQTDGKMNALLAYLRKEKVIVPLKAVLTPVNQFWTSVELYHEIRKEHEQMTGQEARDRMIEKEL